MKKISKTKHFIDKQNQEGISYSPEKDDCQNN